MSSQEHLTTSDFKGGAGIERTISFTPEQFDKLFLSGSAKPLGDARRRFANTTPLGLISFTFTATTAAFILMGFKGSNPLALVALTGTAYYLAGVGLTLAAIGEFILGNTYAMVVFMTFAGFWVSLAVILDPLHGLAASAAAEGGAGAAAYNSAIGLFLTVWTLLSAVYAFLALRTNVCFFGIFFTLTGSFGCLAAAYFATSDGSANAGTLFIVGGALLFVCVAFAWYLFIAQLIDILEFNFTLPVGDLSRFMARKPRMEGGKDSE